MVVVGMGLPFAGGGGGRLQTLLSIQVLEIWEEMGGDKGTAWAGAPSPVSLSTTYPACFSLLLL